MDITVWQANPTRGLLRRFLWVEFTEFGAVSKEGCIWVMMCRKNSDQIYVIFFHLYDCSVPYCASLEAWNLVVAGQHLNASHQIWTNKKKSLLSGIYFWATLNCHITSTGKAFDPIPQLRYGPEYQLSPGTKYHNVMQCDSQRHYFDIDTTKHSE